MTAMRVYNLVADGHITPEEGAAILSARYEARDLRLWRTLAGLFAAGMFGVWIAAMWRLTP